MADSNEPRPVARATKPVSEALLNEKVGICFVATVCKSRWKYEREFSIAQNLDLQEAR